jgi:hypothetical protein
MAHKIIDNKAVVDWTTGDPEGDRINLLSAYRDFIKEIQKAAKKEYEQSIQDLLDKWSIDTENQIDEVPRIWIKRPE